MADAQADRRPRLMSGAAQDRRHAYCAGAMSSAADGCREFRLGSGPWPLRCFLVAVGDEVRAYVNRWRASGAAAQSAARSLSDA